MDLGIISLLLLAVAIAIGFFRKTNVGLVCLLFAFVLGKVAGIPTAEILKGFKPNLFINLMGVTLLFSILNKNGTIELLARKIVGLAGSNKYLIPIAVFIMGALLTGIGPGSIPLLAIMPAIAIPLAKARGYNPLMLAIIVGIGWMIYNQAQLDQKINSVFNNAASLMGSAASKSAQPTTH